MTIELNPNKMMSIIVYKNIFPRDFSELQLNKGFVYTIFLKKNTFIEEERKSIVDEIESYEHQIELCEKEHLQSRGEVDLVYAPRLQAARNYYYNRREEEVQRIQEEIKERKTAVDDKNNFRINELKKIVKELELKRDQLSEKMLSEIITRENIDTIFHTTDTDELGKVIRFDDVKGNEYFDLLKYLLRNGYIDESYNDYMSYFYDNSLTVNDKMFLRSITDRRAKKYDYPIDNVELIFSNLTAVDFTQEETMNFNLFHEILNNPERSDFLEKFMSQLKSRDCFDFLYKYLEVGKNTNEYIRELASRWVEFVSLILENEKYTDQQIHYFCVCFVSYLSNEMLQEMNLNNCISNYISKNPQFLSIDNPDVVNIISNFQALNIKFVSIDTQNTDMELLRQVYTHDMYVLNLENIRMWIKLYYGIDLNPKMEEKLLSIILCKDEEPLSKYVKDNLVQYLRIIAMNNIPNSDEEDIILYVLNEDLEIEEKKKYVERVTYELSELDKIDSAEMRTEVVRLKRLMYSLDNLLSYYKDNGLDTVLIEFINDSGTTLVYHKVESELLDNFWQKVLSCNDLRDEKYLEILDAISYQCDVFTEKELSVSKVEILIERNWILMNEDNLCFMRQTYPEVIIKYAQSYLSEYIELSSNGLADVDEISKIIELPIDEQKKIELLNTVSGEPISVLGKDISSQLCKYIIENNYDSSDSSGLFEGYSRYDDEVKKCIIKIACSDIAMLTTVHDKADIELIDLLLRSDEITVSSRIELMLLVMDRISHKHCKEYLVVLGCGEIAKIFDANRRPKISITSENRRILEAMKNNHFLKDYYEDAEREVFKVARIEEREESL